MKTESKFKFKDNRPLEEKVTSFCQSMVFWKGRKKGIIQTQDVEWNDIRAVFFPKNFHEKYQYLGAVPYDEKSETFKAMEPLVIYMDNKAKPWWCPRWFLRFLHLFGNDNSIVRGRNRTLHNLHKTITKGYLIIDYKTKWKRYDLRISIYGDEQMWFLTDAIIEKFYKDGEEMEKLKNEKNEK